MTELGRRVAAEHDRRQRRRTGQTLRRFRRGELARSLGLGPSTIATINLRRYPGASQARKGGSAVSSAADQTRVLQRAFDGEAGTTLRRFAREVADTHRETARLASQWPNEADEQVTRHLSSASRELDQAQEALAHLCRIAGGPGR